MLINLQMMALTQRLLGLVQDKIKGEIVASAIQSSSNSLLLLEKLEADQSQEVKFRLHFIAWMELLHQSSRTRSTPHRTFKVIFVGNSSEDSRTSLISFDKTAHQRVKIEFNSDGSMLSCLIDSRLFGSPNANCSRTFTYLYVYHSGSWQSGGDDCNALNPRDC